MDYFQIILISLLCIIAVVTDLKKRKIPNKLTVPFALAGILGQSFVFGIPGARAALFGFLLGMFIFLFPYSVKAMGAGDVKLMASIGALSNWQFVLYSALLTAIAGGIMVLGVRAKSGGLGQLFKNVGSMIVYGILFALNKIRPSKRLIDRMSKYHVELSREADNYIPYALAIGLGVLATMLLLYTGRITIG